MSDDLTSILLAKVKKRSVTIAKHTTSISLEEPFWHELQKIADAEKTTLSKLIGRIDKSRGTNLSSALRLYVLHSIKK